MVRMVGLYGGGGGGGQPRSLLFFRAVATNPIFQVVTDADVEMLMGDEAKRQLYADLVEYTMVLPLQAVAHIVATKMHLVSWFNYARLDKMLPAGAGAELGVQGRSSPDI